MREERTVYNPGESSWPKTCERIETVLLYDGLRSWTLRNCGRRCDPNIWDSRREDGKRRRASLFEVLHVAFHDVDDCQMVLLWDLMLF